MWAQSVPAAEARITGARASLRAPGEGLAPPRAARLGTQRGAFKSGRTGKSRPQGACNPTGGVACSPLDESLSVSEETAGL